MKKTTFLWLLVLLLSPLNAQDDATLLAELAEEDRDAVEALVLYPPETRLAILEASRHPEALIRLESMQARTRGEFENLLSSYDREVQAAVWDLTRYPDLLDRLVVEGKGEGAPTRRLLEEYPEPIRKRALQMATEYHRLLYQIYELQTDADIAFAQLLGYYPEATQQALQLLIDLPEVLTILTEHIRLTVLIGDVYSRNPEWLLQHADSLNLEVAREQAREYQDWKESLEKDPAARDDLIASAEAFADEYGYDDDYYDDTPDDDIYYEEPDRRVIEHHYYYHYPYWWGYPSWYLYPRWRPLPWWYDWGFYFQPGRSGIVVIGLPSYYFVSWYFHYPYHHYYYPHLSARFVNYYYGHRQSTGSIVAGVERWKETHRSVVRDEWLAQPEGRVARIREYGRLEKERLDFNRRHPERSLSAEEYLEKNRNQYPRLRRELEPATPPPQRERELGRDQRREPERRTDRVPQMKQPQPPVPRTERPQQRPLNREEWQRIEKAKEQHRRQWDRSKTPPPRTAPRTAPAPRTKEKTTPPKRQPPKKNKG